MNKGLEQILRAAAAVAVLAVIFILVLNWWGDYRDDGSSETQAETGSSVEATETPEGEESEGGEEPVAEDPAEQPVEEPSLGTVVVLVNGLNFRAEPAGSAELLDGFTDGVKLDYLGTESGWYKVRDSKGRVGYVSAQAQFTRLEQ